MKLHLGCWKRDIPGFVNIDLYDAPHIDHKIDVRKLSVIKSGSVELIYASHVLEYFDREEVKDVLKEWKRVLKKGGTLRLAVPNFRKLVVVAITEGLNDVLGPLYGKMKINDKYIYHKTVYDFSTLRRVLREAGFGNVRKYDWKETIHKDYDDHSQAYWPHMNKKDGMLLSLNVEGDKL